MIDMEKVIAGLKECLELLNCIGTQSECKKYISDAIALLQEQNNVIEKANSMLTIIKDKINELLKEQEEYNDDLTK